MARCLGSRAPGAARRGHGRTPGTRRSATSACPGRLVERELHPVVAVGDHLAHQRRVLGRDVVADELGHVGEPHDPVVEVHPLVHLAELDVADHVVERDERWLAGAAAPRARHVAGQVDAVVPGPVHQRVHGVPVGRDGRGPDRAVRVGHVMRLRHDRGACRAGVRHALVHVGHLERHVDDAVAVPPVVVGDRAVRLAAPLMTNRTVAAVQHVGVVVAVAGLRPRVRLEPHPERQLEVQRRLGGVPRGPDHRVPAGHRERVVAQVVGDHPGQASVSASSG